MNWEEIQALPEVIREGKETLERELRTQRIVSYINLGLLVVLFMIVAAKGSK